MQSRSYFAAKVAPGWWIWGIDIALDTRIDSPQQTYFLDVMTRKGAARFPHLAASGRVHARRSRGSPCTAKPVWLNDPRHSGDAYRNLAYFVKRVMEPHGAAAPLILAGDLHHYSRYENDSATRQLITSGGGGAYLSGTHHLPAQVPALKIYAAPPSGQMKTTRARDRRALSGDAVSLSQRSRITSLGDACADARIPSCKLAVCADGRSHLLGGGVAAARQPGRAVRKAAPDVPAGRLEPAGT